MQNKFFKQAKGCDTKKWSILSNKAQTFQNFGPTRTWQPNTFEKIGYVLSGLSVKEMRQIQPACFRHIRKEEIDELPVEILKVTK